MPGTRRTAGFCCVRLILPFTLVLLLWSIQGVQCSSSSKAKGMTSPVREQGTEGNVTSSIWSVIPDGPYQSCDNENWPFFYCVNGINCFTVQQMCDGHDDCGDSSDEVMCPQSFVCPNTSHLLASDKFCDGKSDCADGSDEKADGKFVCTNAWRYVLGSTNQSHWKERRVPYSAEARRRFQSGEFPLRCGLPDAYLCDGFNHCGDHSDECNANCGNAKKFICANGNCISSSNKCDFHDDCGDGSDECLDECTKSFVCGEGSCIPFSKFCDGVADCPDGSDELQKTNNDSATVSCSNKHNFHENQCVLPARYHCDGSEQCLNRQDECVPGCKYSFFCADGSCLIDTKQCDGRADCADMSDECGVGSCAQVFRCNDGSCLSIDRFCDGIEHCPNGEDEIVEFEAGHHYCPNRYNWIKNKKMKGGATSSHSRSCRLPASLMCDGVEHCDNRTDECQPGCVHSFFCDQGQTCVARSGLCDGQPTCADLTDEPQLAVSSLNHAKGFKCAVSLAIPNHTKECVIPQELLMGDPRVDCDDVNDTCLASNGQESSCEQCLTSNTTITKSQICDGVFDCPDLSDECFCYDVAPSAICRRTCFAQRTERCPCAVGQVPCLLETENATESSAGNRARNAAEEFQCVEVGQFCDGATDCLNGADERFCSGGPTSCAASGQCRDDVTTSMMTCSRNRDTPYLPKYARACDGKPECFTMEDECEVCERPLEHCASRSVDNIFTCNAGTLPGILVCDGFTNCPDNSDELNCRERFACGGGERYSVESTRRCDFTEDCANGTDERGCVDTHFYCEGGTPPFVNVRRMFDGKQDCADGSDECPTGVFNSSVFSSKEYLIKNHFLKGMVWVMGLLAVGGNFAVMVNTVRNLLNSERRKLTKVAVIYNCLVLNLCCADFLMGVFLIVLGLKDALSTGNYCHEDHFWRSGALCSTLGVLAVLSSEVSLMTLAILSTYRAYCVIRPVQSRVLNVTTTMLFAACTWLAAGILAFLPISGALRDYFISHAWVTHNPYFKTDVIDKPDFAAFHATLRNYVNVTSPPDSTSHACERAEGGASWHCAGPTLAQFEPDFGVVGYFGYYSKHATCLPKLFVSRGDVAWQFSIAVTLLNFLLCLYIVLAYCVICRPRQINKTAFSSQSTRNMQKKIAVLVASDCACWLPICTIAFLWFAEVQVSSIVYAITAVVLLPINSALNPLFYSNALHNLGLELLGFARKINLSGLCLFGGGGGRGGKCGGGGKGRGSGGAGPGEDPGGNLLEATEFEMHAVSRSESRLVTEHTFVEGPLNESII